MLNNLLNYLLGVLSENYVLPHVEQCFMISALNLFGTCGTANHCAWCMVNLAGWMKYARLSLWNPSCGVCPSDTSCIYKTFVASHFDGRRAACVSKGNSKTCRELACTHAFATYAVVCEKDSTTATNSAVCQLFHHSFGQNACIWENRRMSWEKVASRYSVRRPHNRWGPPCVGENQWPSEKEHSNSKSESLRPHSCTLRVQLLSTLSSSSCKINARELVDTVESILKWRTSIEPISFWRYRTQKNGDSRICFTE